MTWNLTAENIAGIREGHATIHPGNNVVRAANWQGKSSFLQAIETAMGTRTPLTEGADAGRVQLDAPDGSYAVELTRRNGTVVSEGEVFLDDEYDRIRADLYAFLDEDNAVRDAVRRGENLEELLTRPLDFENIEERIADLKAERSSVEAELEEARDAARRLPGVQEDVTRLTDELEELEAERADLAEPDATAENDDREELSRLRAERSQTEQRVDRLSDAVERIDDKLAEVREEYEALTVPDEDVSAELAEVRDRRESIRTDVDLLQSVYSANRRVLEEGRVELLTDLDRGIMGDEVDCWLCGESTDEGTVRDRLDELSDRISELKAERAEYDDRVAELESRREEIREARKRRDDLERRVDDLEAKRGDRAESLDSARERKAELDDRIDDLEAAVAEHSDDLTEIKSEIKRAEAELEEKREELSEIEGLADRRDTLEAEHDDLGEEIAALRNRKAELKRRTREAFDDAIDDLLARFDTSFETARLTSNFDLVVARDGREASVDALSEGELELLGIVAALAGHEAFEVAQNVPIMLLDQLGGLTEGNLSTLVEYLDDRAEFLVFTAYPEHDAFDGNVIEPSEWDVVSSDPTVRP
ncbi:archaea-specific SMC-related protein [Halostella litorea]|uniref:archaea-specific SMC-related protein n=1 Tax=Halostella litorea TaxID=2528831 RepID=UPI0010922011|nr:archaea-specific SMC-related protein [Halostella litorea]